MFYIMKKQRYKFDEAWHRAIISSRVKNEAKAERMIRSYIEYGELSEIDDEMEPSFLGAWEVIKTQIDERKRRNARARERRRLRHANKTGDKINSINKPNNESVNSPIDKSTDKPAKVTEKISAPACKSISAECVDMKKKASKGKAIIPHYSNSYKMPVERYRTLSNSAMFRLLRLKSNFRDKNQRCGSESV